MAEEPRDDGKAHPLVAEVGRLSLSELVRMDPFRDIRVQRMGHGGVLLQERIDAVQRQGSRHTLGDGVEQEPVRSHLGMEDFQVASQVLQRLSRHRDVPSLVALAQKLDVGGRSFQHQVGQPEADDLRDPGGQLVEEDHEGAVSQALVRLRRLDEDQRDGLLRERRDVGLVAPQRVDGRQPQVGRGEGDVFPAAVLEVPHDQGEALVRRLRLHLPHLGQPEAEVEEEVDVEVRKRQFFDAESPLLLGEPPEEGECVHVGGHRLPRAHELHGQVRLEEDVAVTECEAVFPTHGPPPVSPPGRRPGSP